MLPHCCCGAFACNLGKKTFQTYCPHCSHQTVQIKGLVTMISKQPTIHSKLCEIMALYIWTYFQILLVLKFMQEKVPSWGSFDLNIHANSNTMSTLLSLLSHYLFFVIQMTAMMLMKITKSAPPDIATSRNQGNESERKFQSVSVM